jgi:hypothetical protein
MTNNKRAKKRWLRENRPHKGVASAAKLDEKNKQIREARRVESFSGLDTQSFMMLSLIEQARRLR